MNHYPNNNRGFSIVEVIAAAAILSIALIAIVAIIRTGTDIQVSVQHRQAARLILTSRLEERYGAESYNTLSTGTTNDSVTIDQRTGNLLRGNLATVIRLDSISLSSPVPIRPATYKEVTLTLTWQETPDYSDTLAISRWVVE